MSIDLDNISIVHWFPDLEKHKCGYCKNEESSVSYGMWAETLTVTDYQNLIDRGWRRSGKYCYKPVMDETCCPQYTIRFQKYLYKDEEPNNRCNALNFKATKSQKKLIKKFNRFLKDGVLTKENGPSEVTQSGTDGTHAVIKEPEFKTDFTRLTGVGNSTNKPNESPPKGFKKGVGADPSRPPCKKAKVMRGIRKGPSSTKLNGGEKSLEEILEDIAKDGKHKLKMVLVPTSAPGDLWEASKDDELEVYKKYQMAVHNDPAEKCTMTNFTRFLVSSPLKIDLVRMSRFHTSFKETAEVYKRYQMAVHAEVESECTAGEFYNFLVNSPLKFESFGDDDELGFGSFHQQYWLDDKLIAVGVIDVLPKCISSVYFFYDPQYRGLSLGTYGSLREIQFTKYLHEIMPSIDYYYMGFYIHTCVKMRYKSKLSPSDLLCPETYEWCPVQSSIPKLDEEKYSRLNEDIDAIDKNACGIQDVDAIKVIFDHEFCKFGLYRKRNDHLSTFKNIGKLVGRTCARSMVVVGQT